MYIRCYNKNLFRRLLQENLKFERLNLSDPYECNLCIPSYLCSLRAILLPQQLPKITYTFDKISSYILYYISKYRIININ